MAQQLVTDQGTAYNPGAYPIEQVQKNTSGLSQVGVLVLVGEAAAGPDFTLEPDITTNFFGPDQVADVMTKYKSGNLVDAFRAAVAPANDPNITSSPSAIYIIKTNVSAKASVAMARSGLTAYATLSDKSYGDLGNQIFSSVAAATPEVVPTTGSTTYIPTPSGSTLALRVNGGAKQTFSVTVKQSPAALVGSIVSGSSSGLNSLSNVVATGGVNRNTLAALNGTNISLAATGSSVVITLASGVWATTPTVGDTLVIPASGEYGAAQASAIQGPTPKNNGAYIVTAATSTTITATKLRNNAAGALTAPENAVAAPVHADTTDFLCYSPVVVTNTSGVSRGLVSAGLVGQTVTGTATGQSLKLVLATGQVWGALPQVGDWVLIPSTAPSAIHAAGVNGGWYTVTASGTGTAAGASFVTMTRVSSGAPASFSATALAAVTDLQAIKPVLDGVGKTLEVYDGGGTDSITTLFYSLAGIPVTWISTTLVPFVLTSATEYRATMTTTRQTDNTIESITAGGEIALNIGYNGTTASMTISGVTLTTTVTGGVGGNLSVNLTKYKTINALASYIAAQPGYTCTVGTATIGQLPTTTSAILTSVNGGVITTTPATFITLDQGTYSLCSDQGAAALRLKVDAYRFFQAVIAGSVLVMLGNPPVQPTAGLPEVTGNTYLAGGAVGGTLAPAALAAIDACQKIKANFVVPLFSRDASLDIADGLTDASSTYTIDALNAYVSSHTILMSGFKRRRHRQGMLSKRTTFTAAQLAANNIANYRCSMCYQDFKLVSVDGTIKQYQPWMGATLAAAMQAAAFYKSILFKGINVSGVMMADGSMSDALDTDLETATRNGLLTAQRTDTGGFRWNTDQTTYGTDPNFVFNSIQAIYAMDTIALTTASKMEKAFVGASLADVSASVALSYLKGIMSELKRAKLIAGDDSAPYGFTDAKVQINGNTMKVTVTVKLASTIVFVPITFLVQQVQSSAQ